jgi:hypothetical protein
MRPRYRVHSTAITGLLAHHGLIVVSPHTLFYISSLGMMFSPSDVVTVYTYLIFYQKKSKA